MSEIWLPVKGYEGYYEVSNLGRVRGLDRIILDKGGRHQVKKGVVLKPRPDRQGYITVALSIGRKYKTQLVHRLVAEAFIPNPDNLPQINHKDECKSNNTVDNLEWCTARYNCNYGDRNRKVMISNLRNGYWNLEHIGMYRNIHK